MPAEPSQSTRSPVRVALAGSEGNAYVYVDAWDPATPIPMTTDGLPSAVTQRLATGDPFVVAEARVRLGANRSDEVVIDVTKVLEVPSDAEVFGS